MKNHTYKNQMKTFPFKQVALLGCLAALSWGASPAQAGNDTWVGNTSVNWADSNWTGADNPPLAGDSLYFGLAGSAGAVLNNNLAAGTSFAGLTFNAGASAFTLGGNQIATTAALSDNAVNPEIINLPVVLGAASHSFNVVSGGSLLVGGVISDGGNGYGITLPGEGTVTLTNASTFSGATTINAGTLTLDFNDGGLTNNIINTNSTLALGGGVLNFLVNGGIPAFTSQTFSNLAVNAGLNVISTTTLSGTNYPNISFGAVTATVGGVVEFEGLAYSTDTNDPAQTTVSAVATNNTTTAVTGGFGGNGTATGDFATVGLYDWAAAVSDPVSGYDIVGGSQVSGFYTVAGAGNSTLGGNVDFSTNSAGSHNTDNMASMRFNQSGGFVWSPVSVVTTGGMLVTPNVGAANVYVQGTAGELEPSRGGASATVVWQNNVQGFLIFNVNNFFNNAKSGAGTLVLAGPGTVQALYPSTYTGATYINGATALLSGNDLGAIATGYTNFLNGGTIVANATFNMDDAGADARPFALGSNGGALAAAAGYSLTVDGVVSGTTPLTIGIPANVNNGNVAGLVPGSASGTNTPVYATGRVILTGANSASGGVVLDTGILEVGSVAALPTGGLTFNGGTFQWGGTGPDISAQTVTINSVVATLDANGYSVALANPIGNGGSGSVVVTNSGAAGSGGLFLNGGVSYTGGTTVASGAVLGGTATIAGNVTWKTGSYAALSAASPLTVSGSVTLNDPTVQVIASGLTTGVYPLLTATGGITGGSTVVSVPTGSGAIANGYAGVVSISGNTVILSVTELGVSATWTDAQGDQNWSEGGNWTGAIAPHKAGDAATFGSGGVGSPVNLNQNETVGGITFSNASSYTIIGANTLTLDNTVNNVTHPAAISVTGGTANAINTPVALNVNLTAMVNPGDSLAFGESIANESSPETLAISGGGTAVLSAANSYGPVVGGTPGTFLSGSTLQVGNNASLGAGDVDVAGASTLSASAANVTLPNNLQVASLASLTLNGSSLTLNGVISGAGTVTAASAGTLTLAGANNTYAGNTTIGAGIVSISADGATAGGAGSLGLVPATATANDVIIDGGDLLATASLTLNTNRGIGIGAVSPLNTAITTALVDAAAGKTLAIPGVIASSGNLGMNNLTVNSETGSTGTVALGGANTFNGTNIIVAGSELLENPLALQDATLLYNGQGGRLDFSTETNVTIGALLGDENLVLENDSATAVALTLANNNGVSLYTGILSDADTGASLTVNGPGTQQIGAGSSGGATYTGGTTLNSGTLILGGDTSLTGALYLSGLNGNCSLTLQDSASLTATGIVYVAGAGGTAYPGVSTITLLNNANLSMPAFSFGDSSRVPAGCFVTITNNAVFNDAGGFELEYAEGVTVQNNQVNLNGGTLIVSNFTETYATAGTHQATINFNGGVLLANASDPSGLQFLPDLAALTVDVTNATEEAFINSSNYTITIAAPLTDATGGDAGLVKQGSGILILSGANTYTGPTTVSNGTLLVSGSVSDSSENFAVNDGQAFGAFYNGSTPQIGNLTLGNNTGGTSLVFSNLSTTSSAALAVNEVYLNGPSTIWITDAANLTTPGEYPLFSYSVGIVTNSGHGFSLSLPAGLKATLINDTSISSFALNVISYTPPPVSFNGVTVSGTSLVLSATGGTPGDSLTVYSTTNLTLPLVDWSTVTTGTYDGNGNFNYTVTGAISSGLPYQFYIIEGK